MKIDKDVSPPAPTKQIYPFSDMQVGDSFTVPWDERKRAQVAAATYKGRHWRNWNYVTRKEDDTLRVWRIDVVKPVPKPILAE